MAENHITLIAKAITKMKALLDEKANKSDIPSTNNFATKDDLNKKEDKTVVASIKKTLDGLAWVGKTAQANHSNKGVGFNYYRCGGIVTCQIAGICNEDLQNGWHAVANLPSELRPNVTTGSGKLLVAKQNATQLDQHVHVKFSNDGKVTIYSHGVKKGYEWSGGASWRVK